MSKAKHLCCSIINQVNVGMLSTNEIVVLLSFVQPCLIVMIILHM